MRHPMLLLAMILTLACSAADTGIAPPPPAPPPPPPGGTVPSVLAIQAGDGQQADPGAVLTVKPMVAVKDAAGLGVAGVTVTFSIDSGGGSLQATSAVTAADGTAGPGDWHLGSGEGRNVMSAHAGSLPVAKFVAIAAAGTTLAVVNQSLPSGGGTIAISSGMLAGTKLVIPTGAFSAGGTWKLEQQSNASWPRRAGVNPVGAALHITSTDTGLAAQNMLLTLPATVPAGSVPFVLMRSAATGAIEVLQTVTVGAGTITVAVRHFDASWIAVPHLGGGSGGPRSSIRMQSSGYDAVVVVSTMTQAELDADIDTGFRPGVDDWDVEPIPTSFTQTVPNLGVGAAYTEMAYFASMKSGGSLFKKYREVPEAQFSNKVGMRAMSYSAYTQPTTVVYASVSTIRNSLLAGQADQVFYNVLKANLIVSRLPQLMIASEASGGWISLVAYQVTGGRVAFANPATPGVGGTVLFSGGQFAAATIVGDPNQPAALIGWFGTTPIGQWIHMDVEAQELATFAAGQQPTSTNYWPAATVHARGGFVEDTIMYVVDDTTRFWVECPTCKEGMVSTLPPGRVEGFLAYQRAPSGTLTAFNGTGPLGSLVQQVNATDTRLGFVMLESAGSDAIWLDFQWIRAKKWAMTLPTDLTATVGAPQTFTLTIDGPTATPPCRFVWSFGTVATGISTFASAGPSTTATLSQSGTLPIRIEMRRLSDDKVIAVGTSTVVVAPPKQAWRLTSITKVTEVGVIDPNNTRAYFTDSHGNYYGTEDGRYVKHRNFMAQIVATPSRGVIYIWCCGTPSQILVGLQMTAVGVAPNLTLATDNSSLSVGLAGYCVAGGSPTCDFYSASITGDDKSGSISGMWITESKISATKDKDGVTLSGTIRIGEAGWATANSIPAHYVDYTFTATRVP